MLENVRKRASKWDLVPEDRFPSETGQEDLQPAIASETSGDVSKIDLKPIEDAGNEFLKWPSAEVNKKYSKWSDLEAENAASLNAATEGSHTPKWSDIKTDTKDCPKESKWETGSRRNEWGDVNVNRESSSRGTTHGQSCNESMPHNIDARQQNRSISPKGGWNTSLRSWSRSRSRSRSRSHSRDHDMESRDRGGDWSWGRSRSPVHGLRKGGEGWGEKRQAGSGAPCRDFVAGRCKRGGECRYIHEDGGRRFSNRQHDEVEFGESRYERGQSPGYHSKEQISDSTVQRDYAHEKTSHGHASHYGGDWQKPLLRKSGNDNAICNDFKRGRCQRGSTCRYIHHNAPSDGGWEVKGWTRDRLQDGGDVNRRHEFRRPSDTPCKFFAEGRCRNGDKCRFSHQGVVHSQPDGRSCEFMSVHNSDSENRLSWNGPTWDNQEVSMAAPNASEWQRDDRNSRAAPYATVGHESARDPHDQQLKCAEDNNKYGALTKDVSQTALPAQVQSSLQEIATKQHQHVSNFSAQPMSQNVFALQHAGVDRRDGSPRENNSILINTSILKNEASKVPPGDETIPINSSRPYNESNFANNPPANPTMTGQSSNKGAQSQYITHQPSNAQSLNLTGQNQHIITPATFNDQSHQPQASSLPMNGQAQVIVPQTASNMQSFSINSKNQIPKPSFNGQTRQTGHLLPSYQQSKFKAPQPSQNVNYSMEKQSQHNPPQPINLDNQTQVSQEEQLQRGDDVEMKASQTSATPTARRVVPSEQVTQLSNLTASLAQIFGNGPQLPQLYAALNPYPAAGVVSHNSHPSSVGSLASTSATYVQPNQGPWTPQQGGPVSDSTEVSKVDTGSVPPGFSSDPIEQRSMPIVELQAPSKTIAPFSSIDGPPGTVKLESSHEMKLVDTNGDNELKDMKGTVTGPSSKEQQTALSDDANANVQADGTPKRNKDAKGTRMFRFALVEFVKDILRPTWKEGQMSKEAHKTIVKKVVDKVIGTLDTNIPQTQERVDLYLSYSKEKLTKLVQAYMEKYLKT